MCLDMFRREIRERERERERIFENFFWQNEGPRGIYIEKVTLQLPTQL